jgi:hypothetical protein
VLLALVSWTVQVAQNVGECLRASLSSRCLHAMIQSQKARIKTYLLSKRNLPHMMPCCRLK